MAAKFGIWKPLPEADEQSLIVPTIMVAHSIVGSARSAYNYFRDGTTIESHWITTKGGEAWQCMEADRRADANYKVNRFWDGKRWCGALSMETEDNGDPDRDPWTDAQIDTLVEWFRWGNREFGIPLTLCKSAFEPGIGYHSLFPMVWTNVRGKTCPGTARIRQFHEVILPRLTAPTTPAQEGQMIYHIAGSPYTFLQRDAGMVALTEAEFWELAGAGMPVKSVPNDAFVKLNRRLAALASRPLHVS